MSYFAKVLDGKVIDVIRAEPDFFDSFIDSSPGTWIQTSYNTRGGVHYEPDSDIPSEDQSKALRKNYAGVGYTYDAEMDAFIPPKPTDAQYSNWVINSDTGRWEPPGRPSSPPPAGKRYDYDNDTFEWSTVDV